MENRDESFWDCSSSGIFAPLLSDKEGHEMTEDLESIYNLCSVSSPISFHDQGTSSLYTCTLQNEGKKRKWLMNDKVSQIGHKKTEKQQDEVNDEHKCLPLISAHKEECIQVRAKRGQATKSHSLAERSRRERINERMKFLQDLVPGCNKITGKTVMLDEIINYVLSLQQQVEFLSMKLVTVSPETYPGSEQILSTRNADHSENGNAAVLGMPPRSSVYTSPQRK